MGYKYRRRRYLGGRYPRWCLLRKVSVLLSLLVQLVFLANTHWRATDTAGHQHQLWFLANYRTIYRVDDRPRDTGRWMLRNDTLCIRWQRRIPTRGAELECARATVFSSRLVWRGLTWERR